MGTPMKLIDSDDEPEADEFTINKNYAERYDVWRNKEELQKLKDLSKDISSSSSESEEEEELLIEKDFLKTLSLLKSKDPRIYDESTEFFTEQALPKKSKVKKEKPMSMKEYERKIVLEHNGMFIDEVDEDEQLPERKLMTNKEEEELKKSFQEAAPDSDEEDDLFQVRTKTKAEEEKEETDYKRWLETENDLGFLNKYWKDPGIGDDEKFLRDYILNKRYIDDKAGEIPTYDEITRDIDLLSEDEKELQKQDTFEHKYNFRFEEPDEEFIKRYDRRLEDLLRRKNSKRKQKRDEYAERKKKEKEQKREELKRLKILKRKEIEEKFLKLKEASGQDELNLDESDIESDFDPDKHDQKMREMFNDDYYNVEEEQKPEFEYDEEIDDENWDRWARDQSNYSQNQSQGENYEGSSSEEEEENSKQNLKSQFEQEMIDSTTSNKQKKGRKKSLFAKILSQSKPLYDPNGKSFDEYLDEYYKLDCEDVIGDLPVRFKYRKVVPNDFGLTVDEILAAQDKELNRWCSVKKTCQYRDDKDEIYDVQAFKKKAQNFETKKKILSSVYSPPEEEKSPEAKAENSSETAAKPKRKKKRSKKKKVTENGVEGAMNSVQNDGLSADNADANTCTESTPEVNEDSKPKKKKKKKALNNASEEDFKSHLHETGNGAVEENGQQSVVDEELYHEDAETETDQNMILKVKKKKKKSKSFGERSDSVLNSESYIHDEEMNESNVEKDCNTKKKRKKSQFAEENDSSLEPHREFQVSENVISKRKKRKLSSLEKESSFSCAEYDGNNDYEEADLSLDKQAINSASKKTKSERTYSSLHDSVNPKNAAKSIYAENTVENDCGSANRKKKKKKLKSNQQSLVSLPSQKQMFQSRKFHFSKKQNDNDSIQIVDSCGKKIVSSSSRLGAFEINPKKFKNRMIYGKNQT